MSENADVVILGDTFMTNLIEPLKPLTKQLIVDTHNVESRLFRRMFEENKGIKKYLQYLYYRNICHLERLLKNADAVWAVSEDDARFYCQDMGLTNVSVVPNVIDVSGYEPKQEACEPGAVVYTGLFGYWPNEDAALRLIAISRRLKADGVPHKLYLVGRFPTGTMYAAAKGQDQIVITGEVPDTKPYIAKAQVVAVPLMAGSGTKIKILEALAMERAVQTTPIGIEGLDLGAGEQVEVSPDEESFRHDLTALLDDPGRCERLGKAGRLWVEHHGSLSALGKCLRAAFASL
jgi:glycosyltransferase involved in cell wall biosynthesis